MLDLKNIYKEIIEDIKNMTDEQMSNELVKEGCIIKESEFGFNFVAKYNQLKGDQLPLLDRNCQGYSEFKGELAA